MGDMKIITIVSLTALCFAACDSKQEEVRKAKIENQADKLENAAKATAEVVKKEGEAHAEALKDAADKVRDQK
jgi:hypothetical protein